MCSVKRLSVFGDLNPTEAHASIKLPTLPANGGLDLTGMKPAALLSPTG